MPVGAGLGAVLVQGGRPCGVGLGAVLVQGVGPVGLAWAQSWCKGVGPLPSRANAAAEAKQKYTTGEKALLAVVHASELWRCFWDGVEFTVVTDHSPNTY